MIPFTHATASTRKEEEEEGVEAGSRSTLSKRKMADRGNDDRAVRHLPVFMAL
jgi:hypothetical protein